MQLLRRHARRGARAPAGSRAGGAARRRGAEGRRGAARDQPRLRRDDRAEALGGPRDRRLLADRRAVGRSRGARPARRAVRPPRVLRDGLGARRAGASARSRWPSSRTPCAPGIERLSTLGRPDVRLRLPRHHAIASWTTPAGRQPPFIARDDCRCASTASAIALHAARSRRRGGRYLADLRQPHWERRSRAVSRRTGSSVAQHVRAPRRRRRRPEHRRRRLRGGRRRPVAPQSYRELVELDGAHSGAGPDPRDRWRPLSPIELDLDDAGAVAMFGHLLSTQIHRRFNSRGARSRPPSAGSSASQTRARRAPPVPSPRRRRSPDVLRAHRRRGCAARLARGSRELSGSADAAQSAADHRPTSRQTAPPGSPRRSRRRLGARARARRRRGSAHAARSTRIGASPPMRSTPRGARRSGRPICACPAGARRTTSCVSGRPRGSGGRAL